MAIINVIANKEEKERQKRKCKKTKGISHCRQRNNPWLHNILENIPHLKKVKIRKFVQSIYVPVIRSHHKIIF